MKTLITTALWVTLALGARAAMANKMDCGETVIDDEQMVPVTAEQVLAACGEPASKEGGQWVYEQPGHFTKILQFDSDGNLRSITDQPGDD
jgi:hypothetical protein